MSNLLKLPQQPSPIAHGIPMPPAPQSGGERMTVHEVNFDIVLRTNALTFAENLIRIGDDLARTSTDLERAHAMQKHARELIDTLVLPQRPS